MPLPRSTLTVNGVIALAALAPAAAAANTACPTTRYDAPPVIFSDLVATSTLPTVVASAGVGDAEKAALAEGHQALVDFIGGASPTYAFLLEPGGDDAAYASMEASFETMTKHKLSDPIDGLQPLSMEGTTLASSRMYTHNAQEREQRKQWYALDKQVATSLSPNITRTHKTLDVGEKGEHAFYMAKVEIGVSMEHPLFTSKALRELELASAEAAENYSGARRLSPRHR